jgi:hypothetical protein
VYGPDAPLAYLGDEPIEDIRRADLQDLIARLIADGHAPRTIEGDDHSAAGDLRPRGQGRPAQGEPDRRARAPARREGPRPDRGPDRGEGATGCAPGVRPGDVGSRDVRRAAPRRADGAPGEPDRPGRKRGPRRAGMGREGRRGRHQKRQAPHRAGRGAAARAAAAPPDADRAPRHRSRFRGDGHRTVRRGGSRCTSAGTRSPAT